MEEKGLLREYLLKGKIDINDQIEKIINSLTYIFFIQLIQFVLIFLAIFYK